jgi:hypothetical protein
MKKYHITNSGQYHVVIADHYRIGQDGFMRLYATEAASSLIEPVAMFARWESITEQSALPNQEEK